MSAKILLADDDPAVCQFVDVILKQAGYSVVRAADGVEAMERVRQSPPDLILLDILMPGRDGLDVLRSLRQNTDPPPRLSRGEREGARPRAAHGRAGGVVLGPGD